MKKILILGLFFSLLVLSGCSFRKNDNKTDIGRDNGPDKSGQVNREPDRSKEEDTKLRLVINDAFTLEAPANWRESSAMMPGISLMMVNGAETSDRPEVKKVNFRSYFSVSYDKLGENTLEQYASGLKKKLAEMISGITFQDLEPIVIDGRPARVFSGDLTQQGINFKLLVFAVEGGNKDVWMISFNTLAESLDGYQDLFFEIAKSFRIK